MSTPDTSSAARSDSILVGCSTWNVNGKLVSENLEQFLLCPSELKGSVEDGITHRRNDIIAVGLQEIEQTASATFLETTSAGAWWIAHLSDVMSRSGALSPSLHHPGYTLVGHKQLVGLLLAVYIRSDWSHLAISSANWSEIHCGIGNILGNKGALALRLVVSFPSGSLTSFVFVNAHMAAHEGYNAYERRNQDFLAIGEAVAAVTPDEIASLKAAWAAVQQGFKQGGPSAILRSKRDEGDVNKSPLDREYSERLPERRKDSSSAWNFVKAGSAHAVWAMRAAGRAALATHNLVARPAPTPLNKSDVIFWMGDLNYRLEMKCEEAHTAISAGNISFLKSRDQLANGISRGHTFPGFREGDVTSFPPTYKFDPGTNTYDSSPKRRCPSWCDRILWRVMPNDGPVKFDVTALTYSSISSYSSSDHKPVIGVFSVRPTAGGDGTGKKLAAPPATKDLPDLISF